MKYQDIVVQLKEDILAGRLSGKCRHTELDRTLPSLPQYDPACLSGVDRGGTDRRGTQKLQDPRCGQAEQSDFMRNASSC